jgi:hypothetical protein
LPQRWVRSHNKEARKLLNGVPLVEAARYYEKHNLRDKNCQKEGNSSHMGASGH